LDRSAQLLSQVIHLLQLLGIPGRRIYLFGFSQGCAVAMHYALRSTVPLGGVVGLSGFVESPQDYPAALGRAAKLHPYLVCHGFEDDMVPLQPTRDAVEQLKILGLPVDWFEGTFGHEIDPGVELDVIRESLQRWMESN
jgi:phospholipase/carboxylesterase